MADMFLVIFNTLFWGFLSMWPVWTFVLVIVIIVLLERKHIRNFFDWAGWEFFEILTRIFGLYILYLLLLFFSQRDNFWKWVFYGSIVMIVIVAICSLISSINVRIIRKKIEILITGVKENNLEESIYKFIDEYSHSSRKLTKWNYRGYSFDPYKLEDLSNILQDKGINASVAETLYLVKRYIEKRERAATLLSLEGINRSIAKQNESNFPYQINNNFLTENEKKLYYALENFGKKNNFHILSKVRLEDLLYLPLKTKNRWKYHNKVKSYHIDFVICDYQSLKPKIAIELNDSTHSRPDRQKRDKFIKEVFESINLPLLWMETHNFYDPNEISTRILNILNPNQN